MNANIANFVLAVQLEMKDINEVYNLEIYLISCLLKSNGANNEVNCKCIGTQT